MSNARTSRRPLFLLRLALSLVAIVEILFVVKLIAEGVSGSVLLLVSSIGLIVLAAISWRPTLWSCWALLALLVLRMVEVGSAVRSFQASGDQRFGGTLLMAVFYLGVGVIVASSAAMLRKRRSP